MNKDKQKSRDQRYVDRRHANGYINLRVWVKKENIEQIKNSIKLIESGLILGIKS